MARREASVRMVGNSSEEFDREGASSGVVMISTNSVLNEDIFVVRGILG